MDVCVQLEDAVAMDTLYSRNTASCFVKVALMT